MQEAERERERERERVCVFVLIRKTQCCGIYMDITPLLLYDGCWQKTLVFSCKVKPSGSVV